MISFACGAGLYVFAPSPQAPSQVICKLKICNVLTPFSRQITRNVKNWPF
jgi:hypothetical protein